MHKPSISTNYHPFILLMVTSSFQSHLFKFIVSLFYISIFFLFFLSTKKLKFSNTCAPCQYYNKMNHLIKHQKIKATSVLGQLHLRGFKSQYWGHLGLGLNQYSVRTNWNSHQQQDEERGEKTGVLIHHAILSVETQPSWSISARMTLSEKTGVPNVSEDQDFLLPIWSHLYGPSP